MPSNEFFTSIFLLALITGLLTISYWTGVSDIEDFSEEDDLFGDF